MDFTSPNVPAVGAVFPGRNATTSLSYHEEGQHLFVASAGDHQLQVVDAVNGKAGQQALRCEREKLHLVEATYVAPKSPTLAHNFAWLIVLC